LNRSSTNRLARIASQELERAMREMRIRGYPRPFYISCLIREEENWRVQAKYGALIHDNRERRRNAFVDVRVGSYRADQIREGGLQDNDKEAESYGYVDLPFGDHAEGLRHGLWRLTDARYREAVESLLEKRSHALTYLDPNRKLPAFEKRPPTVEVSWRDFPVVDHDFWTGFVERTSRTIRRHAAIKDSHVEFEIDHNCRIFVNSDGSRLVQCQPVWSLECYLWMLAADGNSYPWTIKHTVTDPEELPDERRFLHEIRETVVSLERLARASTIRSFCGPALLEPVPAGLLIHEAVGHRLEGNRLLALGEGQTFKDSQGQVILPEFLSIRDDPRMMSLEGKSLVGHYRFDDEGVEAQSARLVDRGRLVGFLTTRTGISKGHRSNGHARARYHQRPISRMGVLVVEPEGGLEPNELKRALLEEIRRKKAPFGIRIVDARSGETATDAYNFQAFLGEINLAAKVYPDGREEWIRGVNFVGTPLNGIHNIVAAGNRLQVDNAFCGAESGYVPVSTISPALVLSELELQAKPESPYTQFSLPIPWAARDGDRSGQRGKR
jgi:predicted Zn-dependent protease